MLCKPDIGRYSTIRRPIALYDGAPLSQIYYGTSSVALIACAKNWSPQLYLWYLIIESEAPTLCQLLRLEIRGAVREEIRISIRALD